MNLNYDQSPEALVALLATANKELPSHYIAVDYDGEVLIDPELHYPDVDVKRYKFCTQLRKASISNARRLQALHHALMNTLKEQFHSLGGNEMSIAA